MIIYLIKSTFLLLVLLLIYKWSLENKKSLQFNRFYLLFSLLLGFLLPLLNLTFKVESNTVLQAKEVIVEQLPAFIINTEEENNDVGFTWYEIVYYSVTTLLLFKFIFHVFTFYRLKRTGNRVNSTFGKLVLNNNIKVPFSFYKYIYLNKNDWNSNTIDDAILYHEQGHIIQKHSVDIILIEFLGVFLWFQPFVYYYKRLIQENHEYLADEYSLNRTENVEHYQHLILNCYSHKQSLVPLSSSIHFNNLKKRFIMMKNTKKGRVLGTVFYSSTVLVTYFGFIGIEAKATQIEDFETSLKEVVETKIINDFKNTKEIEQNSDINKNNVSSDTIFYFKYKKNQNSTGSFYYKKTGKSYLYLISSDQSSVLIRDMSVKGSSFKESSKYNIKYTLVEDNDDSKNEKVILTYIKGEKSSGYFNNKKDRSVYFYTVDENLKVSIYNRYGVVQNEKDFSYELKAVSKAEKEKLTTEELTKSSQIEKDYQEKVAFEKNYADAYKFVQKKARPKEGLQAFMQTFVREFKMPEEINSDEIKMSLRFIVESDGSLSNFYTPQEYFKPDELYSVLKDEAIRVLKTMPSWHPAEHEGKIVRSSFVLPITIKVKTTKTDE